VMNVEWERHKVVPVIPHKIEALDTPYLFLVFLDYT